MAQKTLSDYKSCFSIEFESLFVKITKSRYANHYIFKDGLTQLSALSDARRHEKEEIYDENICSVNPCHFDFSFTGIRKGGPQYNCDVNSYST